MTELDDIKQMFRRFESQIDIDYDDKRQIKDSEDVVRKFGYWQNRPVSPKLKAWIKDYLRASHPEIPIERTRGVTERKQVTREQARRRYTTHVRKGRRYVVARIPKGKAGAGRFAKK